MVHPVAKLATNASCAILWPNLQPMQVAQWIETDMGDLESFNPGSCLHQRMWVIQTKFDLFNHLTATSSFVAGWCLLSSLNQTVQRKIEGGKLCVKGWHSRVESEVRTKQDLSKLCEFSIKSCVKFRTYSQRLHRHSYHLVWVSGYHGATYNPLPPFLSLL